MIHMHLGVPGCYWNVWRGWKQSLHYKAQYRAVCTKKSVLNVSGVIELELHVARGTSSSQLNDRRESAMRFGQAC